MPKIEHLEPPSGFTQISIDRFSPYHSTPEQFGIGALTPFTSYNGLYPADAQLADIAYHFTGDYVTPLLENADLIARLRLAIGVWQNAWRKKGRPPTLRVVDQGQGDVVVTDTRQIAASPLTVMTRDQLETLILLERPHAVGALGRADREHIAFLRERNFVVEHEGVLQSVVNRPTTVMGLMALREQSAPAEALATSW
jgi:hypothetical protein